MVGQNKTEYRESFFGGGSVGISLLEKKPYVKSTWINNIDSSIAANWNGVLDITEKLKRSILTNTLNKAAFISFKEELRNKPAHLIKDVAFKKIACHRMSYSGLGTKGGARKDFYSGWNLPTMCSEIDRLNHIFSIVNVKYKQCTSTDMINLILNKSSLPCVIYLDPPYYLKGPALYQYPFALHDHTRLSQALRLCKHKWLLSYDDGNEIRSLYAWAKIIEIPAQYSAGNKIKTSELLIPHIVYVNNKWYTIKFTVFVINFKFLPIEKVKY